jgi:hypothetical protein
MQVGKAMAAACALFVLGAVGLGGCSTDAVGIETCRLIQTARCEVAPLCKDTDETFGIETPEQVENCKVYYIDGCLVGVENDSTDGDVKDGKVCAAVITSLGSCLKKGTAFEDCKRGDNAIETTSEGAGKSYCQLLQSPELLKDCAYVEEPEEDEE